jgi:membrane associated rhomboid family serine protease
MTPAAVGLRCPEHSGKPQGVRKVTSAAERVATGRSFRRPNVVTTALIAINVIVYLAELALGADAMNGTGNWIYNHGVLFANGAYENGQLLTGPVHATAPAGFQAVGVSHGEWWRLLTAAFLHYGPIHLALNMYSLYFAGSILEQVIGPWRFALLYLVSGLAGSAGALYLTGGSPTAGASGAIFGVLGALLVLERRGNISTGGQVAGLIVLNLIFTFAVPGISVGGHVGGLIGGFILMLAFVRFRRSWPASLAAAAVVTAAAIFVAYASI